MAFAAPSSGDYYQWSATALPPTDAAAAGKVPEDLAPPRVSADAAPAGRLTDRLNRKLGELRSAGYTILWIAAPLADLTTLLLEGGDQAILMDPDPERDVAWYGGCHIRHSVDSGVRVFLEGEIEGEMSCHIL
jgi:hypothetical protein